jgi:hypothetical protein
VTLPAVLVPTYVQMLKALSAWLGKADAQMRGGEAAPISSSPCQVVATPSLSVTTPKGVRLR